MCGEYFNIIYKYIEYIYIIRLGYEEEYWKTVCTISKQCKIQVDYMIPPYRNLPSKEDKLKGRWPRRKTTS